jgi:hypothetical protein
MNQSKRNEPEATSFAAAHQEKTSPHSAGHADDHDHEQALEWRDLNHV